MIFKDRESFENNMLKISKDSGDVGARLSHTEDFVSMLEYYGNKSLYNSNYRVTSDTSPFVDDLLANVLTPEGIVQIEKWIFKIDMPSKMVYCTNDESKINLLYQGE